MWQRQICIFAYVCHEYCQLANTAHSCANVTCRKCRWWKQKQPPKQSSLEHASLPSAKEHLESYYFSSALHRQGCVSEGSSPSRGSQWHLSSINHGRNSAEPSAGARCEWMAKHPPNQCQEREKWRRARLASCCSKTTTTVQHSSCSNASLIVGYSLAGHDAHDFADFEVFEANGALIEARLNLLCMKHTN